MLAYIDNSIPRLFSAKSVVLFLVLSFLAYLISARSPLGKQERDKLALVYPMLVLVYFVIFQVFYMWLIPGVGYYIGRSGAFVWSMNSGICCAFGIAFSIRIIRMPDIGYRFYGGFSLLIFLLFTLVCATPLVAGT